MPLVTHSPSLSLPDAIMQVSRESEQHFSVSWVIHFPLALLTIEKKKDSGSGIFANAQNVLITGGTIVVVSLSCGPYKQLIYVYISTIFYLPILGKGI